MADRRRFVPLEGHPGVEILIHDFGDRVAVAYRGTPAALIAAGVATAEEIAPGTKGKPRVDHAGYRYFRECLVGNRFSLHFGDVDRDFAATRPGLAHAMRRLDRRETAFTRFLDAALSAPVEI